MITDRQKFFEVSQFISESITGETLPLVTRVQAIEAQVPLAIDLVGALGEALEQLQHLNQEPVHRDGLLAVEAIKRIEMVARLEGALAALILVGEELLKPAKKPRKFRAKKTE